jgi:diguanylate cyclase (GGDEF)-like protein/PAS domain S-box-containing protein
MFNDDLVDPPTPAAHAERAMVGAGADRNVPRGLSTDECSQYEALLQFLYLAPIGLVQAKMDGEVVMVNPLSAMLLMPLVRDGSLDNLFTVLQDVAPDLAHQTRTFSEPYGLICDGVHLRVDAGTGGQKEAQILSLKLLKLDDERLMAVLSDVTREVHRERALRQSQSWINSIVHGPHDYALLPLDEHGRASGWNAGVQRVTGFTEAETIGRSSAMFFPPDGTTPYRVLDRLAEADRCGWTVDEGWRLRADGSRYWGNCLIAPLPAPDVEGADLGDGSPAAARGYSLVIRDVSDRREASEALWRSFSCDHLTGLVNRRAFFEAAGLELHRWQRAPRPLSVLMVDADDFKKVNDRHGHAGGDAVLCHLAGLLTSSFRGIDVIARLGGEEFVVLLPDTGAASAEVVAERFCERVAAEPVLVDGAAVSCTVSIGVAAMEPGIETVEDLLRRADKAMYRAKFDGRNRVRRWIGPVPAPDAGES